MEHKQNIIIDLTFEFSILAIKFSRILENDRQYHIAEQLFRCSTSIGANIWEAQSAESNADFIHKLKIADKESRETQYWLLICKTLKETREVNSLLLKIESIIKVLSKIISSSKKKNI